MKIAIIITLSLAAALFVASVAVVVVEQNNRNAIIAAHNAEVAAARKELLNELLSERAYFDTGINRSDLHKIRLSLAQCVNRTRSKISMSQDFLADLDGLQRFMAATEHCWSQEFLIVRRERDLEALRTIRPAWRFDDPERDYDPEDFVNKGMKLCSTSLIIVTTSLEIVASESTNSPENSKANR